MIITGTQPQALNSTSGSSSGQILNPSQGQGSETFYSTTTPPQDLNQAPNSVDALAATLSKFSFYLNFTIKSNLKVISSLSNFLISRCKSKFASIAGTPSSPKWFCSCYCCQSLQRRPTTMDQIE